MRRRTWEAKTQAMIVREGLKGKPVAEVCTAHQISQAQYYPWRDQFLAHAPNACEVHAQSPREARLAREHARLNTLVGELTPGAQQKRRGPGLSRQPSLQVVQHNPGRLDHIPALKAEHPCWGYRRIWADLRCVDQLPVNQKRMLRLLREHHRLVTPQQRLKAQRTPTRSTPKPTRPHEWWGMDMTQVLVQDVGGVDLVVVLDWYTTTLVGYHADLRSTAQHGLAALDMAVNRQCPHGVRGHRLSLRRDHGGQPTAVAFMQACRTLGRQQTCTSSNHPTGHADTARMRRTRQEECLWLHEWTCPFTFIHALGTWIAYDNAHDLHSALGYKPPREFKREYDVSHGTQLPAA